MKDQLIKNIKSNDLFSDECKNKLIKLLNEKKLHNIPLIGFIYKIENLLSKKIYIGQSTYLKRPISHFTNAKKGDDFAKNLYEDIRIFGRESFKVQIIDVIEASKLGILEQKYIEQFNSIEKGYNTALGGNNKSRSRIEITYEEITKTKMINSFLIELLYEVDQQDIRYSCLSKIGRANLNDKLKERLKGFSFSFVDREKVIEKIEEMESKRVKKENIERKFIREERRFTRAERYHELEYDAICEKNMLIRPGFGMIPLTSKPLIEIHTKKIFNNAMAAARFFKIEVKHIIECCEFGDKIYLPQYRELRFYLKERRFMYK